MQKTDQERLETIKEFFEQLKSPELRKQILDGISEVDKLSVGSNRLFFIAELEKYIDKLNA